MNGHNNDAFADSPTPQGMCCAGNCHMGVATCTSAQWVGPRVFPPFASYACESFFVYSVQFCFVEFQYATRRWDIRLVQCCLQLSGSQDYTVHGNNRYVHGPCVLGI